MVPSPTLILVLLAGTNEPSNSATLADAFIEGVRKNPDVIVEKIHIRDLSLDHFTTGHYKEGADQGEGFRHVRDVIERAAGVVIATPVWNFSVPAHLKNLIDHMGSFCLDAETRSRGQLKEKPFYLIFTGGAPHMAWRGMMRLTTGHVPEAMKYYGGTLIGLHYEPRCTQRSAPIFDLVVDKRPESLERMRRKGEWFARASRRHAETGELPKGKKLYRKLYEWAQKIVEKL